MPSDQRHDFFLSRRGSVAAVARGVKEPASPCLWQASPP
jgi:hypothetical protein